MNLRVTLLILAIGILSLSSGAEYDESGTHSLTAGEAISRLTLMKREIKAKGKAAGRGLVYSGPVKVITDPNDHSKYYMDKGSAFDYTQQEPQQPRPRVKQQQRMMTVGKFHAETPPENGK